MIIKSLPVVFEDAATVTLKVGQTVFTYGQTPGNYLVVLEGCIRVTAISSEGREVVLYRVMPGEMCALTTACLLGKSNYQAEAIVEAEATAKLIPAGVFHSLLNESESFRTFVFEGFSLRLADVMERFEQVVLKSIDQRLAAVLLYQSKDEDVIETTHERLASEIGTAREVVSRHLKYFEKKGLIATGRGHIRILDSKRLDLLVQPITRMGGASFG